MRHRILVAILLWLAIGAVACNRNRELRREAQLKREAAYASELASFERYLRIGMTREEVESSVASQSGYIFKTLPRSGGLGIYLGEEPGDSIFCDRQPANLMMDFDSNDRLSRVHIAKIGHCSLSQWGRFQSQQVRIWWKSKKSTHAL